MIAGYIRVSTLKQAEYGVSIEMQKDIIIKHAMLFEIVKSREEIVFYVDDGYSAKSLERPAMTKLIADIRKKKIDVLFVYDQARLGRDMWDIKTLLEMFERYGVKLKCLYDDVSIDTASDRFRTYMGSLHNQYERERICERTNDALKSIAERGGNPLGGKPLIGYARDENKNFVIDKENAPYVRKAFDLAIQHQTLSGIVIYLKEVLPKRKWCSESVRRMLSDKKYIGVLEYKGKSYTDIIPPIISKEVFENAQRFFRHRKRKKNEKYYYEDLIYCSCGSKMSGKCAIGRSSQYYYYYHCIQCNKDISQLYLNRIVSGEIETEYFFEKIDRALDEMKSAKKGFQKKAARIKEKYLCGEYEEREYLTLMMPLEEKIDEINEWIGEKNNHDVSFSSLKTDPERKEDVQSHINMIEVDVSRGKVKKIVYRS